MNLRRSTRYGLYAAAELARSAPGEPLTVARVAEVWGIPVPVLSKVFQQLVREGIAIGTRGSGGGYHLARPAAEISLLRVIEAFEPVGEPGACVLRGTSALCCDRPGECPFRRVLDEVDEITRTTFASISLETLIRSGGRLRDPETTV